MTSQRLLSLLLIASALAVLPGCGVKCCDNTRSPTCMVARSGCCSGHGGMCPDNDGEVPDGGAVGRVAPAAEPMASYQPATVSR